MPTSFWAPFAPIAFLVALGGSAALPAPALAQPDAPEDDGALASIDDESRAALGLYVTSAVLAVGGATSLALSFGYFGGFAGGGCPPPGCGPRDRAAGFGFFIAGVTAIPLAAVLLAIAIGLDVDSGSRRGALSTRRVALAAGPGEVGLGLVLRFDS